MNPTQVKVINQVDEKAIVGLAGELIMIPSFKLEETPVATFLADGYGYSLGQVFYDPYSMSTLAQIAWVDGLGLRGLYPPMSGDQL